MNSTSAPGARKPAAQLWGALGIAVGGAIGVALDHLVLKRPDGLCTTTGILAGVTFSTYLEMRGRRGSHGWTALCGFAALWYFTLRFFFRT